MHFKGLIMEKNIENIIVMKENGTMVKLINKEDTNIGDTIYFVEEDIIANKVVKNRYTRKSWFIPLATVAMLAIMFISPIISSVTGSKSYAMVSLDINPSTNFILDKNQNIIEINNINSDSENLKLDELIGMNVDEALKIINNKLLENGYLKNNGEVLASLSFYDEIDDIEYEETIKKSLANGFSEAHITYIKSNKNNIKEAKKKGISIGRYQAYIELSDDLLEDSIENMSIVELNKLLSESNNSIKLNEEILDEVIDELEDRIEDSNEEYDDNSNHNLSEDDDDDDDDLSDNDDDLDDNDSDNNSLDLED